MDLFDHAPCGVNLLNRSALSRLATAVLFLTSTSALSGAQDGSDWNTSAQPAPLQQPEVFIPEATDPAIEIEQLLKRGYELEGEALWGEAIGHYEKATRKFPQHTKLYQRMVISRLYYDVNRRYKDDSFLTSLKSLSTSQALDLYSEVLANLQTHYVEQLDWSRVIIHGTAALEIALSEKRFLDQVLPGVSADQVGAFRNSVHSQLQSRSTATRFDLRASVSSVAARAERELGISGTPVVLEFLSGAVSTLDPYTRLLSPSQLDEMFSNIEGNFVGLGVELKTRSDYLQVLSVIPGGPADLAGMRGGQKIVGVDGSRTHQVDPNYVADLLRGPENSMVKVDIISPDGTEQTLSVQRRRVDVPCVENIHFVDVDNRIGYFRLTNFQKTTTRDVEQALWQLHRQGMRSLIIDVRGNPGGLLSAAVEVADRFINEGAIVTTRGRNLRENFDYKAHRPNTWSIPIAVLIDRESASASEIFAGAIADNHRGAIIGETSYGKGSVQGIFRMQTAKFGLCLTTAKFYSPSGRAISQNGVIPTVPVAPTYIAARPDDAGNITVDRDDAVLQQAVRQFNSHPVISQLAR